MGQAGIWKVVSKKGSFLHAVHSWAGEIQRLETELRGVEESLSPDGELVSTLSWEECLWNINRGPADDDGGSSRELRVEARGGSWRKWEASLGGEKEKSTFKKNRIFGAE